jgi:hypothetical protein
MTDDDKTLPEPESAPLAVTGKQKRGFAVMNRHRVRELAQRGGTAARVHEGPRVHPRGSSRCEP